MSPHVLLEWPRSAVGPPYPQLRAAASVLQEKGDDVDAEVRGRGGARRASTDTLCTLWGRSWGPRRACVERDARAARCDGAGSEGTRGADGRADPDADGRADPDADGRADPDADGRADPDADGRADPAPDER